MTKIKSRKGQMYGPKREKNKLHLNTASRLVPLREMFIEQL